MPHAPAKLERGRTPGTNPTYDRWSSEPGGFAVGRSAAAKREVLRRSCAPRRGRPRKVTLVAAISRVRLAVFHGPCSANGGRPGNGSVRRRDDSDRWASCVLMGFLGCLQPPNRSRSHSSGRRLNLGQLRVAASSTSWVQNLPLKRVTQYALRIRFVVTWAFLGRGRPRRTTRGGDTPDEGAMRRSAVHVRRFWFY